MTKVFLAHKHCPRTIHFLYMPFKAPVLLNTNACCLFRLSSAQHHWIDTAISGHFTILAPVSKPKKKNLLAFSQAVTTPEYASYQWLPWQDLRAVFCHLTLSHCFISRSAVWKKRTFLSNTNLQSYKLLFNNHRALDIFL